MIQIARYKVLIWFFVGLPAYTIAQYYGGNGQGAGFSRVIQLQLDGSLINTLSLYQGGKGDGNDCSFQQLTLNGDRISNLYLGGVGQGITSLAYQGSLSGTELKVLYAGGNGDGIANSLEILVISGTRIEYLFKGGTGDGIDFYSYAGLLSGTDLSQLYQGGLGDGSNNNETSSTVSGVDLSILYGGGMGQGYTDGLEQLLLNGTALAQLYMGGHGDGHGSKVQEFIFVILDCTFVTNTNDNGPGSLRNAITCAISGDEIAFSPDLALDTIMLSTEQLTISKDLSINGSGIADLYLDARQVERAIKLNANSLSITGLNIIGGTSPISGAIENGGTLVLENLTIIDPNGNSASVIDLLNGANLNIKGEVRLKSQ